MGLSMEGYIQQTSNRINTILQPILNGDSEFTEADYNSICSYNQFLAEHGTQQQKLAYFFQLKNSLDTMKANSSSASSDINVLATITAHFVQCHKAVTDSNIPDNTEHNETIRYSGRR